MLWLRGFAFGSAPGSAAGLLFGLAAIELLQASLYILIGVIIIQVSVQLGQPAHPARAGVRTR